MSARLRDMAHFVIQHTPPERLGATKLNKVLWFADVMHYRLHGATISGAEAYEKNQFGPVPVGIQQVIRALKRDNAIFERPVPTPSGVRREFVWREPVDARAFSAAEIETLREVIDWASPLSAKEISDLTHDALWDETERGHLISIAAASVVPSEPDQDDLEWAASVFGADTGDAVRAPA